MSGSGSWSVSNNGKSEDFWLQLSRGQIQGHRGVLRTGFNPDIDSGGYESLWDRGGLYVYPPSASVMTVSSSSALDTAAGTGARTVLVQGLDANYVEIQEVVTLNGQTAVNTVNSFLRIFGSTVLTAGSGAEAAGNIHIGTGVVTAGVPAVVYGYIAQSWNLSQTIAYTVPAGYTAYLIDIIISASQSAVNQSTVLSIRARAPGGVFMRGGSLVIAAGLAELASKTLRSFPEKTDIDAVALTTDTNVIAGSSVRFMLVSNALGD